MAAHAQSMTGTATATPPASPAEAAENYIDAERLAEILGVSWRTIHRMTVSRLLPSYRFGRSRKYLESECRAAVRASLRVRAIGEL